MVAEKLLNIMKATGYIKKDGKIDMGAKGKYSVLTERKVLQMLRPHFVEQGLVVVPLEVTHIDKTGSTTTLAMRFRIIDPKDKDFIDVASIGQGTSTGDKGAGSAFTYALKYLLMKITMQESGDDPDIIGDDKHEEEAGVNELKAISLAQEVSLLMKGKMLTQEVGAGMIKYLSDNKNDPAILRDAETKIGTMKGLKNG